MIQELNIPTPDGLLLPAFLIEPSATSKGVILLGTGLGIPKEFYKKYLLFLGQQGYTALVFDYRGINPTDKQKKAENINLRNWGVIDLPTVLTWLHQQYANQPLYFFGHSIAGQVAGLMNNHDLIDRYFFFCSTTGHHSVFGFPLNIFTWFMFNLHIPITSRLFGYMPPSLTYRGVKIAKGVALEWAEWSRQRAYISAFFTSTIPKQYYEQLTQSIDWIYFKDDPIATKKAIHSMMAYYPNATITAHPLDPSHLGLERVGHSGFFTSKAEKIWRYPLDLLERTPLRQV